MTLYWLSAPLAPQRPGILVIVLVLTVHAIGLDWENTVRPQRLLETAHCVEFGYGFVRRPAKR
jgi:hypothetical protein